MTPDPNDESLDGYCGANPNAAREVMRKRLRHDHKYEAGAYGTCRRCGDEYARHVASGTA